MAEDKTNSQTPIDPDAAAEAIREVQEAKAILPNKRFGCLGRFAKYGVILLLMLAAFVYWNFLRTPPLKISKETTYITEPLTSDGKRVDYFAAIEKELYPPAMRTDNNGYRLIVRALGDASGDDQDASVSAQTYQKLGLDPALKPTLTFLETHTFFKEHCARTGLDERQAEELDAKVYRPWTLKELPMMESWLEQNGPVLDLVSEAVRKPTFCIPLVRADADKALVEGLSLEGLKRPRSFARMLQTRAHYRIGTGELDGAIDDIITCQRLGRHMEHQGTLVARLVGIAIQGIAGALGIAADQKSQPNEAQLQRLVKELNALPPRPDMERLWLIERYCTLDALQAAAVRKESLEGAFALLGNVRELWGQDSGFKAGLAIAEYISVDWNTVLRRANAHFDDIDDVYGFQRPTLWSPGNLMIGSRSRRVGDFLMAMLSAPPMQATREADRRANCVSNLQRIVLAMLLYEREHGTLPPAYTVDADSKPLHSWRVLLLPYLGKKELYDKIRLAEPWESKHNRQFHEASLDVYQCPSAGLSLGQTRYSVIVGKKTAFQAAKGKTLDGFGMNLILVVERKQPVCWMAPTAELAEAVAFEGIGTSRRNENVDEIRSQHPGGLNVGLRNGGVNFISQTIDLPSWQGLLDGTARDRSY